MSANMLVVLAAVVATCSAKPFYFSGVPVTYVRAGRAPSIAYGFGSGFASDINGVKHSNSIGASIQSGDAEAYGAGIGSADGRIFANGVGYAHTNPAPAPLAYTAYPQAATPYYTYPYNVGYNNFRAAGPVVDSYGNGIALTQNTGNFGNSIAQSQNTPYGSIASATNINNPYQRRNNFGGSAISYAVSTPFGSNAKSLTQTYDEQGPTIAVAAAEDAGGVRGSTAQTFQQRGGEVQNSGATSITGQGIQASHAHAVNTGDAAYYQ